MRMLARPEMKFNHSSVAEGRLARTKCRWRNTCRSAQNS